ncbi:MAG: hypothetical protein IT332_08735 [Ardenticatenales bacterium]|nr:hypothetical protein [Ardenticatenales bacterium]
MNRRGRAALAAVALVLVVVVVVVGWVTLSRRPGVPAMRSSQPANEPYIDERAVESASGLHWVAGASNPWPTPGEVTSDGTIRTPMQALALTIPRLPDGNLPTEAVVRLANDGILGTMCDPGGGMRMPETNPVWIVGLAADNLLYWRDVASRWHGPPILNFFETPDPRPSPTPAPTATDLPLAGIYFAWDANAAYEVTRSAIFKDGSTDPYRNCPTLATLLDMASLPLPFERIPTATHGPEFYMPTVTVADGTPETPLP